ATVLEGLEYHLHGHADAQLLVVQIAQAGGHAHALVHLHHQHRIGEDALEFRGHGHVADRPGIEAAATAGLAPAPAFGSATGTHEARDVAPGLAVETALEGEHALGAMLPELLIEVVLGPGSWIGNVIAHAQFLRIAR